MLLYFLYVSLASAFEFARINTGTRNLLRSAALQFQDYEISAVFPSSKDLKLIYAFLRDGRFAIISSDDGKPLQALKRIAGIWKMSHIQARLVIGVITCERVGYFIFFRGGYVSWYTHAHGKAESMTNPQAMTHNAHFKLSRAESRQMTGIGTIGYQGKALVFLGVFFFSNGRARWTVSTTKFTNIRWHSGYYPPSCKGLTNVKDITAMLYWKWKNANGQSPTLYFFENRKFDLCLHDKKVDDRVNYVNPYQ